MDTVFDDGTVAARPFPIDGDIARGPGVSDMKGGLLTGFVAMEVLQAAGFDGFEPITYVCNPDEEIGSPFSGPIIKAMAPEFDAAFVLEGARANGDIVSARKGITDYTIDDRRAGGPRRRGTGEGAQRAAPGRAHDHRAAGSQRSLARRHGERRGRQGRHAHQRGAGALHAAGRPPVARARNARRRPKPRSRASAPTRSIPDLQVEVRGDGWHRPMEKKEGGARLAELAIEVAAELGFELRDAATGGASDANTTSAAGTPTIDGLGPIGGDDHAPAEWLDLSSVVPRISLLAGIMARL